MKINIFLALVLFLAYQVNSQNLHSNSACFVNESNSTTEWVTDALILSDNSDSQHGLFSIRIEQSPTNIREVSSPHNCNNW